MTRFHHLFSIALIVVGGAACLSAQAQVPSEARPIDLSTNEVEQKTRLVQGAEDLTLSLFAAPPEVNYPAAITATPQGNLFVGVDRNGSLDRKPGRGEILKVLDTDNDGQADHYSVFVDSLDSPRGLVYDGNTLYVMHPPTLTAFTDTDGDGVADRRKTLVDGLGFGLDFRGADHTTNGMQMGIDGWLYVAVGDYGFLNATGADGRQISNRGGGIVRVRPDGSELEIYATGLRNSYDIALNPTLDGFVRGNTNDGYRWRTRLQHVVPQAHFGYPSQFHHFADEVKPPLADYGGGSGTGALYVDAPGLPDSLQQSLYTVDWGRSAVFRHQLTAQGASYEPTQELVLRMPQPTDLTIDGRSNLYVSSWMGASFTYAGEDVGFIVRLGRKDADPPRVPHFQEASTEQLLTVLAGEHSRLRLHAQRELLRRSPTPDAVEEVAALVREDGPTDVRVAALFTLKQWQGADSHSVLMDLTEDPELREFALRALADRRPQTDAVSTAPFVEALSAEDPRVRLHAVNGLARLGASGAADDIVPLVADPDRTVSHVAVRTLVELEAVSAALRAVRHGSPGLIRGGMKVLVRLHQDETVEGLRKVLDRTPDPFTRRQVIGGLARLYHKEAETWTEDDWWGTTPSPRGPYYEPVEWTGSDRIRPLLRTALLDSEGYEYRRRVQLVERNRVVPDGATGLLTVASDSVRAQAVDALLGNARVTEDMLPSLDTLAGRSLALQRVVTDLLTVQRELPAASVFLLGEAARETALRPTARADALRTLSSLLGKETRADVTTVYARVLDEGGHSAPVAEAIRDYVGGGAHGGQANWYAEKAAAGTASERKLAFAILLHLANTDELDESAQTVVQTAIQDGWDDPVQSASLLWAIGYTQMEGYAAQVRQHLEDGRTADVKAAAQYAANRLGL